MTRSVAMPARCQWEILNMTLLLATAFFFDCVKILMLKTYPPLETDEAKRVLVAETIPLVS